MAVNGARRLRTEGTAAGGMCRYHRDAHLAFAGLDPVNIHSSGEREQGIVFHQDLISLSTSSHTILYSVSSLLSLPTTPAIPRFTKVVQDPLNAALIHRPCLSE